MFLRKGSLWVYVLIFFCLLPIIISAFFSSIPSGTYYKWPEDWDSATMGNQASILFHIQPSEIDLKSQVLRSYSFSASLVWPISSEMSALLLWPTAEWQVIAGFPPKVNGTYNWSSLDRYGAYDIDTNPRTGAQPWPWQLSRSGDYPWDQYSLTFLFGFNATVDLAGLSSSVYLPSSLADEWRVTQNLQPLPYLNSNQGEGTAAYFRLLGFGEPPSIFKNYHQFYEFTVSFSRLPVDVFRGAFVFWVPSILIGSLLLAAYTRRTWLSAEQGLTLFLGVGLTTFSLIVGATQLFPPTLTWVETFLYFEVGLSIAFACWLVLTKIGPLAKSP